MNKSDNNCDRVGQKLWPIAVKIVTKLDEIMTNSNKTLTKWDKNWDPLRQKLWQSWTKMWPSGKKLWLIAAKNGTKWEEMKKGERMECMRNYRTPWPQSHETLTKLQHHKAAAKFALECTPWRNTKGQAHDDAGRRNRAPRPQKRRNGETQEDELKKYLRKPL